ncbi:hypothetical protein [Algoriphagus boritolerans]
MVFEDLILPMEGGHLPFKQGTFETHVGNAAMEKFGKPKWKNWVSQAIAHFNHCFQPDQIVLGGGNSKLLDTFPSNCRLGSNKNAITGGFRLWEKPYKY